MAISVGAGSLSASRRDCMQVTRKQINLRDIILPVGETLELIGRDSMIESAIVCTVPIGGLGQLLSICDHNPGEEA